jgi:hypothetical protein
VQSSFLSVGAYIFFGSQCCLSAHLLGCIANGVDVSRKGNNVFNLVAKGPTNLPMAPHLTAVC